MIKYAFPAAVALAFGAPVAAQAQMTQPAPLVEPNPNMTNASTTVYGAAQPGSQSYTETETRSTYSGAEPEFGGPQPMPGFYMQPVTPRTTWIPGHYNWDPNTSNYVWTTGQYVEAPTATAQWVPGHWVQTPTSWIWIEGNWH